MDRAGTDRHVCIVIANLPAERDRRVIRECQSLEAHGYAVTVIAPRGDPDLTGAARHRPTRDYGPIPCGC